MQAQDHHHAELASLGPSQMQALDLVPLAQEEPLHRSQEQHLWPPVWLVLQVLIQEKEDRFVLSVCLGNFRLQPLLSVKIVPLVRLLFQELLLVLSILCIVLGIILRQE